MRLVFLIATIFLLSPFTYGQLTGTYNVAGPLQDFATLKEVCDTLNKSGISGNVQIKIWTGSYQGNFRLNRIQKLNPNDSIVFTSNTNDASTVFIFRTTADPQNFTFKIDSCSNVVFKHLTIEDRNTHNGYVVQIGDHSNNIKVRHCSILPSQYGDAGVYLKSSFKNRGLTIEKSIIRGGNRGIYIDGKLNTSNVKFDSIEVYNQHNYGIDIQHVYNLKIAGSSIAGANSSGEAAKILACDSAGLFERCTFGGRSQFDYCNTTGNTRWNIVNNMFLNRCYISASQNINFYHNNVYADNSDAVVIGGSPNTWLYNNCIYTADQNANAILFSGTPQFKSDCNNLYADTSTSFLLEYKNYSTVFRCKTLACIKSNIKSDSNSISTDPVYDSITDLHVNSGLLDGVAKPLQGITYDFDLEQRDSLNPDIGADEFVPIRAEAGIDSIHFVHSCGGYTKIYVDIKNYANDTLHDVTILWSVNQLTLDSMQWSGTVPFNQLQTSILIDSIFTVLDTSYIITAWTTKPNFMQDEDPLNDTLTSDTLRTKMFGTYTVGSTSADFTTISEAAQKLNIYGICSSVRIEVKDGVYNEQFTLYEIDGANLRDTIHFTSQSADSSKVTIRWKSDSLKNYLVKFNGADHVTLSHFTFKPEHNYWSRCVEIFGGSNRNTLEYSLFIGTDSVTKHNNENQAIILSNKDRDNLWSFKHSHFINGTYGISLGPTSGLKEWRNSISNNQFSNQKFVGVWMWRQDSFIISNNNHLNIDTTYAIGNAIAVKDSYGGNIFKNTGQCTGVSVLVLDNAGHITLTNNSFTVLDNPASWNSAPVIHLVSTVRPNLYHNTLVNNKWNGIGLNIASSDRVTIVNNIISAYGLGPALSCSKIVHWTKFDHNNYFTNGTNLVRYAGNPYQSINDWINVLGQDSNSYEKQPLFRSKFDSHIKSNIYLHDNGLPGFATYDRDGQLRDSKPDIGSDEFNLISNDVQPASLRIDSACTSGNVIGSIWNTGNDTLKSCDYYVSINGNATGPISWSGALASDSISNEFILINYPFQKDSVYTVRFRTDLPNGIQDSIQLWDTLTVSADLSVNVQLAGKTQFCYYDSTMITVSGKYDSLIWYNNSSTDSISTDTSGTYFATAWNDFGCFDVDTVNVIKFQELNPVVLQIGDTLWCSVTCNSYQWRKYTINISGATNKYYKPQTSGIYDILVVDTNSCIDTSKTIIVTNVGLEGTLKKRTIQIHPNPTDRFIHLTSKSPINHIRIYNSIGGLIENRKIESQTIDLSGLGSGLYVVQYTNNEGQSGTFNIVVK